MALLPTSTFTTSTCTTSGGTQYGGGNYGWESGGHDSTTLEAGNLIYMTTTYSNAGSFSYKQAN